MTSTPKKASSTSSGTTTTVLRSRSSEQRGDHEADRAAGLLERSVVSPRCGWGMPLAMCTSPSTPNSSAAQPITCRPAGPLLSGSRRLRQATKHSSSGTNHAEQPDRPGHHRAGEVADSPGQLPPHGGGDHDGEADQEQPGTVAAVLGVEVAGGVADLAHARAEHVRHAEPHGGHAARRGRRRACRWGQARCVPPAGPARRDVRERPFAAGLRRVWLPDDRVFEEAEPCSCPSTTPVGKTYGSPWSRIYVIVTPVTGFTRREAAHTTRTDG